MINESLEILKQPIEQSLSLSDKMRRMVNSMNAMEDVTLEMYETIQEHEKFIRKRMYLSMIHCRILSKTIKERVSQLCTLHKFSYRDHAKFIYPCIYNSLYESYSVCSYRELPDIYFDDILERVRCWDNADKIRDRITGAA